MEPEAVGARAGRSTTPTGWCAGGKLSAGQNLKNNTTEIIAEYDYVY
jgi:hypothetical protein